jgi:hypothetical protein
VAAGLTSPTRRSPVAIGCARDGHSDALIAPFPRLCPVNSREAAQRWAQVWERGWREHDADAIAALYADGAFWQQHPFRDPDPDYLARIFAEEESAECKFGTPIVDGDQAVVSWQAQTKLVDGGTEDLSGVSVLRFGADGLVLEHRDFWASR